MRPEFTEEFIKWCSKADKALGYQDGSTLGDIIASLKNDSWALDAIDRDGSVSFEIEDDIEQIGPWTFYGSRLSVDKEDIANWDDYYAWRITMEKLK